MENAICRMKTEKAASPTGITADLLKFIEKDSIQRLTVVPIRLLQRPKMPDNWGKSELIPLYSAKDDTKSW